MSGEQASGKSASESQAQERYSDEEPDADSRGWMIEVLEEAFAKKCRAGLEEDIFPRAVEVQELTKGLQEHVAEIKQQLNHETEAFDAELANLADHVRNIQLCIKRFLNTPARATSVPDESAVPGRTGARSNNGTVQNDSGFDGMEEL